MRGEVSVPRYLEFPFANADLRVAIGCCVEAFYLPPHWPKWVGQMGLRQLSRGGAGWPSKAHSPHNNLIPGKQGDPIARSTELEFFVLSVISNMKIRVEHVGFLIMYSLNKLF